MTSWLVAAGVAATAAVLLYWRLRGPSPAIRWTLTFFVALVLDAPISRARATAPWVFVDASMSMERGRDSLWKSAWDSAAAVPAESTWVFGDSVRRTTGSLKVASTDAASRLRPVVERTMVSGRPAVIVTDGEVDDSSALD